ncbi:MAG: efflux RND transporter periplasmic adaptor subunit [Marinibacterium sp.]
MRLIPTLTALVVMVALYFLVLQRDALLAFARNTDPDVAQQVEADEGPETATTDLPPPPVMGVVVRRSQAQQVQGAVVLRGETRAARQVQVRAETSDIVISDPLRKGAYVEAGQELCRLDAGTRHVALAEARAQLSLAKSRKPESEARLIEALARLDEARIDANAAQKLSQGGYASDVRVAGAKAAVKSAEAAVAAAEAGLESAEAGVESAKAQVAFAEKEIDRLTISAPFSGYLESDSAEIGSFLQAGALCATIIQLDPIKLVGFLPETEVSQVTLGAPAHATLAAGGEAAGRVTFLSRSADPTTRTFAVEIDVDNPDRTIRDGQTAEISIGTDGTSAHRLPQSSLTLNNEGRLGVRIVNDSGIVEFVPVRLLRDDAQGIWVTGLPEEADVIVVGQDFVTAGLQVAVTYEDAAQ